MNLRYLVIDVDGTMTDGGIYYDEHGNELKKFCTRDAAGFFVAHLFGIKTVVLTGRECAAVKRRMKELKVNYLFENARDKRSFLEAFMKEHSVSKEELGYIGDDLNDLSAMKMAGFIGCPADSCAEVMKIADYVSCKNGGYGAVRDIVEHLLRECGMWEQVTQQIYESGV